MVLRYAEPEWFASWLVQFGADVVVLDPPEVRDAVVERLREIAGGYRRPTAPGQPGARRGPGRPGPGRGPAPADAEPVDAPPTGGAPAGVS
jgi:hypothetical protein